MTEITSDGYDIDRSTSRKTITLKNTVILKGNIDVIVDYSYETDYTVVFAQGQLIPEPNSRCNWSLYVGVKGSTYTKHTYFVVKEGTILVGNWKYDSGKYLSGEVSVGTNTSTHVTDLTSFRFYDEEGYIYWWLYDVDTNTVSPCIQSQGNYDDVYGYQNEGGTTTNFDSNDVHFEYVKTSNDIIMNCPRVFIDSGEVFDSNGSIYFSVPNIQYSTSGSYDSTNGVYIVEQGDSNTYFEQLIFSTITYNSIRFVLLNTTTEIHACPVKKSTQTLEIRGFGVNEVYGEWYENGEETVGSTTYKKWYYRSATNKVTLLTSINAVKKFDNRDAAIRNYLITYNSRTVSISQNTFNLSESATIDYAELVYGVYVKRPFRLNFKKLVLDSNTVLNVQNSYVDVLGNLYAHENAHLEYNFKAENAEDDDLDLKSNNTFTFREPFYIGDGVVVKLNTTAMVYAYNWSFGYNQTIFFGNWEVVRVFHTNPNNPNSSIMESKLGSINIKEYTRLVGMWTETDWGFECEGKEVVGKDLVGRYICNEDMNMYPQLFVSVENNNMIIAPCTLDQDSSPTKYVTEVGGVVDLRENIHFQDLEIIGASLDLNAFNLSFDNCSIDENSEIKCKSFFA